MSVPDGVYPRINAALHSQRKYGESLVSLVGRIVSNDGSNVILECGDGGKVPLTGMDPAEFQQKPGDVIEAIGHATENDANMMVSVIECDCVSFGYSTSFLIILFDFVLHYDDRFLCGEI